MATADASGAIRPDTEGHDQLGILVALTMQSIERLGDAGLAVVDRKPDDQLGTALTVQPPSSPRRRLPTGERRSIKPLSLIVRALTANPHLGGDTRRVNRRAAHNTGPVSPLS